ncbi:hypothetical protein B7R74_02850 [Yersinia pseudotuberculosis]|uniref:Uncharacterized protein n=2 Tax=Yersinia pseudotuberculosis complex TaxID=1649845 RepID=A0A0T9JHN3_YERPU|nr:MULTISPECIES: DUF6516 family protein [Yersinia pseudotuberculosis complex]PSH23589.1 hypothetical protein B7R74_02850 [Yersinia pseudotuberculosis]CNC68622.1 Uncharacterised protein [Yersinia pseudotuberculosis]CRG52585.1 Uncharacterised protein [Yersinia wautersii]SUP81192.1 Uncharacterised protein [Yersinia pseudotuberculosis]
MDSEDYGLPTLLDLHGSEFTMDSGYWWKIEAYQVEKSQFRPHGIRYNLTLHDRHNQRVFGMDNTHGVTSPKKGSFTGKLVVYDHIHRTSYDKGHPYMFKSAEQLIADFFSNIDRIIKEIEGE